MRKIINDKSYNTETATLVGGKKGGEKNYLRRGEWSGYTIRASKRGWIYEGWSRAQGDSSGATILMPYSPGFPRGQDLYAEYSDWADYGQVLADVCQAAIRDSGARRYYRARILRHGAGVK